MNDPTTRLYGMADPSNRQDSAENGLRGEGAGDVSEPAFHRTVRPADHATIEVEEISGVAFVEASRPAPHAPAPVVSAAPLPSKPLPEPASARVTEPASAWPWIVVSVALGYMAGRRRGRRMGMRAAQQQPVVATGIRQDLDQVLV